MLFQTYYRLDPWRFEPPLADFPPCRFDLNNELFSLYINYIGAIEHDRPAQLLIRAIHARDDVPDDVAQVFQGEIKNLLGFADKDGLSAYPHSYRDFVLRTHAHMDRSATNLFNVIRWRFGIDGGPLALTSNWASMRWHDKRVGAKPFDEHGFLNRGVPVGVRAIGLPEMQSISLDAESAVAIEEIYKLANAQPLYHDLFREAWQNRSDNPRSALVMAIASAETAFKTTAADLSNDKGTEWMFENLASPPLDRMLRDYLELLPARRTFGGEVRRPPKSVITTLKEGIELRNKLVHGRSQSVEPAKLNKILIAVRDLLYLLDFYRGHDWAASRWTPDFADEIRKGTV